MEFSWENVLHKISKIISKPSYETWLKSTKAELNGNTVTILSPNSFARDWIENHYKHMISEIIEEIYNQSFEIIVVNQKSEEKDNYKYFSSQSDNTDDSTPTLSDQLKQQQEKINDLEKRIQILEQKLDSKKFESKMYLPLNYPI